MQSDEDILDYWFEKKNLRKNSRELYTLAMKQYSEITGKTISELYYEADKEEEQNIKLDKRNYSYYIIKYKKHLTEQKKSPHTIRIYLTAVKSFYNAYKIKQPDITLSKGDIGLEQNYGRLLQKKEIRAMIKISSSRNRAIIYLMALSGISQKEVRDLPLKKFVDASARALDLEINNVEDLFKHEKALLKDTILELEITRKKVNYRCQSFIPPEVTEKILVYLKERQNGNNQKVK